jgi:hypothetical protein
MYKDRDNVDGRIKFGPLWDFDLGFGNTTFQDARILTGWQFDYSANQDLRIVKIMRDTAFTHQFSSRWFELRKGIFKTDYLLNKVDSLVNYLNEGIIRNYKIWPIIDQDIFNPAYHVESYEADTAMLKNWIRNRLTWIDENISSIFYEIPPFSSVTALTTNNSSFYAYPNPFNNNLNIAYNSSNSNCFSYSISDIVGRVVIPIQTIKNLNNNIESIDNSKLSKLTRGIYVLNIYENGSKTGQIKIIKE